MKFILIVRDKITGEEWEEEYDYDEIDDLSQARDWGEDIISSYNDTLRPMEHPRELVAVSAYKEGLK